MMRNQRSLIVGTGGEPGKDPSSPEYINYPGSVQVYKFPFEKVCEVAAHGKPMIRLRLSFCNNYLFSTGEDGHLYLYDVKDKGPGGLRKDKEIIGLDFSDEILTQESQIEELNNKKAQLQADNSQLQDRNGYKDIVAVKKKEEELQIINEDITANQMSDNTKLEALSSEKQNKASLQDQALKSLDHKYATLKEQQKNEYSKQMLADQTEYQKLHMQKEENIKLFQEQIETHIYENTEGVNNAKGLHLREMNDADSAIKTLQEDKQKMKEKHVEIMRQIEDDAIEEIEQIKKKNKADITKINDLSLKSKADLQLTKNKKNDLEAECEELERDKIDKNQLLNSQKQKNNLLEDEQRKKSEEINLNDQTIGEKEKQIYQLKKKTQELEKFKFVLDYKIKELKREIAPKEKEINELKSKTQEMDEQLKSFNKVNANMGIIVDDLKEKQDTMQAMIKKNRTKIRKNDIMIKSFKDDVYKTVQSIDHFQKLQQSMTQMYEDYVKDKNVKTVEIDPDIQKEYENQRTYLQNSVTSLKKKKNKDKSKHEMDNIKIMKENMKLIEEINDLREHISYYKNNKTTHRSVN